MNILGSAPKTKLTILFSTLIGALMIFVYSHELIEFLTKFVDVRDTKLQREHVYLLLVAGATSIAMIVCVFLLLFIIINQELRVAHWRGQVQLLRAGTHTIDKLTNGHLNSIQNIHVLFEEFAEALTIAKGAQAPRTPHLGKFVNRVKDIFDIYSSTGQCAVCIKFFVFEDTVAARGSTKISTALRDDVSMLHRRQIDRNPALKEYDANNNTAFFELLAPQRDMRYFFCNNLKNLKDYQNANPHWRKYYNSAIVVPIKPSHGHVQESALGFLCVDSKSGQFNEDIAVDTLVLIATLLYNHLGLFQQQRQSNRAVNVKQELHT
ncbi:MAG: hypothetical protein C5B44_03960 [Acidobacteria bacterium]|nr:MAG: hypothetical protein C5B44_03960 [Acidobacteriota bacterium]